MKLVEIDFLLKERKIRKEKNTDGRSVGETIIPKYGSLWDPVHRWVVYGIPQ